MGNRCRRSVTVSAVNMPGEPLEPLEPATRRWMNIGDKNDLIAWPTTTITRSPLAADIYVDVSAPISRSDDRYWASKRCRRAIAKRG
ncbi:MAG: hypothetical protein AAGH76_14705 [Pseudomonadota bacterium]